MILLSCYAGVEIDIYYSGIRPGGMLYEELLNESERQSEYVYPQIYIGKVTTITETEQKYVLDKLLDVEMEELRDTFVGLAKRKILVKRGKSMTV